MKTHIRISFLQLSYLVFITTYSNIYLRKKKHANKVSFKFPKFVKNFTGTLLKIFLSLPDPTLLPKSYPVQMSFWTLLMYTLIPVGRIKC